MKFISTGFEGLILIKHNIFRDKRGFFKEKFRSNDLENLFGEKINFCQENSVKSKINVLRGLHFQEPPFAQAKLISISYGKILDVAVDIREGYKTYGTYFSYILDANKNESIFIPKGFAHGYLTLSDSALINYHVDNYYNPDKECGIPYDDNFLKINWGIQKNKIIISKKDNSYKSFQW